MAVAGYFVGMTLVFRFLGGLSWSRSLVLGLAVALAKLALDALSSRLGWLEVRYHFDAFNVAIHPQWLRILADHELLVGPDEWRRLCERVALRQRPFDEITHELLTRGVCFTVLLPDRIYFPLRGGYFVSRVEHAAPIELEKSPISELTKVEQVFVESYRTVDFYVRTTGDGYELGIVTPQSRRGREFWDDKRRIPLATIPNTEFLDFYQDMGSFAWKRERWEKTRKAQRQRHGWTCKERDQWSYGSRNDPTELQHRYFTVHYRSI